MQEHHAAENAGGHCERPQDVPLVRPQGQVRALQQPGRPDGRVAPLRQPLAHLQHPGSDRARAGAGDRAAGVHPRPEVHLERLDPPATGRDEHRRDDGQDDHQKTDEHRGSSSPDPEAGWGRWRGLRSWCGSSDNGRRALRLRRIGDVGKRAHPWHDHRGPRRDRQAPHERAHREGLRPGEALWSGRRVDHEQRRAALRLHGPDGDRQGRPCIVATTDPGLMATSPRPAGAVSTARTWCPDTSTSLSEPGAGVAAVAVAAPGTVRHRTTPRPSSSRCARRGEDRVIGRRRPARRPRWAARHPGRPGLS